MDNIFYDRECADCGGCADVVNLILNGQYLLQRMWITNNGGEKCRKPYSKWTISSTSE